MTRARCALVLVAILSISIPAVADQIILKNGGSLTGRIVREDKQELELLLDDGMKMTIRKSRVASISRTSRPTEPAPKPDPRPAQKPPLGPEISDVEEEETTLPHAGPPEFFERTPAVDWDLRFSRYPILHSAKTTRFRAYEFVSQSPLAIDPGDVTYSEVIKKWGHGGSLSVWEFQYVGNMELRYQDEVKFVAEITAPKDNDEMLLIRLKQGPEPFADRVVVLLVKRRHEIKRYVTTTTFTSRDFRTSGIAAMQRKPLPVRTYSLAYSPIATSWLLPEESDFLRDIHSPFGNSVRIRLARYRFRLEWFGTPKEDRPGLDPDLLERNSVKPVALPGRPTATEEMVIGTWGTEEKNREKLVELVKEVRTALGRVGVRPGGDYYLEQDRIGMFGRRGLTIETRRRILTRDLLETLLGL